MKRWTVVTSVCFTLAACGESDEFQLSESLALSGDWSGQWTISIDDDSPRTEAIDLQVQDSFVLGGRFRGADFVIENRDILFDERQNGAVYREGDRLFRSNLELPDFSVWSLGFVTDETGDRALIGDFFSRVGAIQRTDTIATSSAAPSLDGRWSGRFAAIDNPNPDDAELETGDLTLDCTSLVCAAGGTETFALRFVEPDTPAWAGTVEGLITNDELLRARAVASPDGEMLALAVCARVNDVAAAGFFCAYAALTRQ